MRSLFVCPFYFKEKICFYLELDLFLNFTLISFIRTFLNYYFTLCFYLVDIWIFCFNWLVFNVNFDLEKKCFQFSYWIYLIIECKSQYLHFQICHFFFLCCWNMDWNEYSFLHSFLALLVLGCVILLIQSFILCHSLFPNISNFKYFKLLFIHSYIWNLTFLIIYFI